MIRNLKEEACLLISIQYHSIIGVIIFLDENSTITFDDYKKNGIHVLIKNEPFFFQYRNESTESIINEMNKIKLDKISGKVIPLCSLTNKQKQIMSFYHLSKKDTISLVDEFTAIQFPN